MDAIITIIQTYQWVFILGFGILAITALYELIADKS